jgi:hypothetical protein
VPQWPGLAQKEKRNETAGIHCIMAEKQEVAILKLALP